MNQHAKIEIRHSTCPHDCPSACALDVEVVEGRSIGRVRGSKKQTYTAGVVCAKVARYAERIHHPERVMYPMRRTGPKGSGQFARISWDEALDEIGHRFNQAEREFGAESVWPYYYAGTMGLVMRDGLNRLTHVKKYSRFYQTICANVARIGYAIGTGKIAGVDPREMALSDLVVIWGTNPVNTQVNVMTHAARARKERGAKIAAVDIYDNETMKQADIKIILRPGTDGAFACGVMHVLFRDGYADRTYMDKYTDCPAELEAHLKTRTPEWASAICGVPVAEIEAFAKAVGETKRTFFRYGYGFTRSRNGATQMHAANCIPAVTGAWQYEGGGAFFNNYALWHFNEAIIEGHDAIDRTTRALDQSKIGRILTGDAEALLGKGPVKAMLIQNTNPMTVAPEQALVAQGFAREDLFVAVHEQFMTETALMADIVLPATMFMEHDDLYYGGGHQHISVGPKLIDPPDECRSNHQVLQALAPRLGARHQGFEMTPRELIDATLKLSNHGDIAGLEADIWRDLQPDFRTAHFLDGFGHADGKFHFRADWAHPPFGQTMGDVDQMPSLPDHWAVIEHADQAHPFRLATSPSRSFLNTTFNETPSSQAREGKASVMIHPLDAAPLDIVDGDAVTLGNTRGETTLNAVLFEGVRRGVLIAESVHPNKNHIGGRGINTLTGADTIAPIGGAAFHDNKVWIRKAAT
ncbi:molybdopterin-dependent oxidoreductase [Bradyrhizobium diazoefficiens]|nr:molybdopterin-dependent oxidoreductase [Bradyrhizobium diazoefficiens]KOY07126.1 dehydrogenase [Bradyrhizobium diazoefficiens]MCD9297262.1 molybdopterin-dependent oxidoreductase [Bradyrhizobium diazoefficiens]MCD9812311.1 molybdopterin-dependent oxidoreductase [Bradyrhizobium diazoefficiens]MCD9830883.1 molybdopterin-dependent oxidoreductase [Bradyrhizobium diazoefficiens]MCD9849387.1 molybdopterin-dependent oxidoreductase [Bradyrhizobium diazoefficiens]